MPYILEAQRALEFAQGDNVLNQAAESLRSEPDHGVKAQTTRDFLCYLVNEVYGELCFDHSQQMASMLNPDLVACANMLSANISKIFGTEGGRDGLLNYTFTRLFNEAYPSARYKDYNAIAGILASMSRLSHPGNIELLGMLSCCAAEYYRKLAAPYEDLKESQNGKVGRPDAPAPTEY